MKLFWIPIDKTSRKTKIIHFPKKQNNIQAFFKMHIRPIQSYFSVDSTFFKKSLLDFIFS